MAVTQETLERVHKLAAERKAAREAQDAVLRAREEEYWKNQKGIEEPKPLVPVRRRMPSVFCSLIPTKRDVDGTPHYTLRPDDPHNNERWIVFPDHGMLRLVCTVVGPNVVFPTTAKGKSLVRFWGANDAVQAHLREVWSDANIGCPSGFLGFRTPKSIWVDDIKEMNNPAMPYLLYEFSLNLGERPPNDEGEMWAEFTIHGCQVRQVGNEVKVYTPTLGRERKQVVELDPSVFNTKALRSHLQDAIEKAGLQSRHWYLAKKGAQKGTIEERNRKGGLATRKDDTLPFGVTRWRNKFKAQARVAGKKVYLGLFLSPEEAGVRVQDYLASLNE